MKKPINILALDLGTFMGWSVTTDGLVPIQTGVQVFALQRGESPGMRYLRFMHWLAEIAQGVDVIYFEQPHMRGGHATAVLAGFVATLQMYAANHKIETCPVHTATLKKFATGSGRADKSAMIAAAEKRFGSPIGHSVWDDNEADARWLLEYAISEIGD